MKVQYIGESFGAASLTSDKIYECLGVELDGNALRVIDDSEELIDRVAKDDMVRGVTIAAGGFFGPQGRELRIPLADPKQNDKIEAFEYKGFKITNFEMESSALAGLSRLMGHKAMTVCMVIANRLIKEANTGYKNTIDTLLQTVLDRI